MYKLTLNYVKKWLVAGVLSLVNLGYSWAAGTGKLAYQKNLVGVFRVFKVARTLPCDLFHLLSVEGLNPKVFIGLDDIEPVLALFGAWLLTLLIWLRHPID